MKFSLHLKLGGEFYPRRANMFAEVLEDCGLVDARAVGGRFTWFRTIQGNHHVFKRLDRMVMSYDWRLLFP